MPGSDRAAGRVVAQVVLMLIAAVALRGYLPGAEREPRPERAGGPVSLLAVGILLGVSLAIFAVSLVVMLRERRASPLAVTDIVEPSGRGSIRRGWRYLLIALAALVAWLVVMAVLTRLGVHLPGQATLATEVADPPRQTGARAQPSASRMPGLPGEQEQDLFPLLLGATTGFVLLAVAALAVMSQRRSAAANPGAARDVLDAPGRPAPPATDALARAAEVGLAEIGDIGREPREAIIACYAAMERELTRVPGAAPQDFDTPAEVLDRAVELGVLRAESAYELVDLFEEARFSPHLMTEAHRDIAVRVLGRVLAELSPHNATDHGSRV